MAGVEFYLLLEDGGRTGIEDDINNPVEPGDGGFLLLETSRLPGTTIENTNSSTDSINNYVIDDRTGFKVPIDQALRTEWGGLMVRKRSLEAEHPQNRIYQPPNDGGQGSPSPELDDSFISTDVEASDL